MIDQRPPKGPLFAEGAGRAKRGLGADEGIDPTNTSEVRRKTVGRQSLSRLRRQLPLHKGAFSCGGGEGRTGASAPTTVEAGMG